MTQYSGHLSNQHEIHTLTTLINERQYYLNKSRTKVISVGLSLDLQPTIKISGKSQKIILNEEEWEKLLVYEGVITNFFYSACPDWNQIDFKNVAINFIFINDTRVIKLNKSRHFEVFLAEESIIEIFKLQQIINYNLGHLKNQNFKQFYEINLQTLYTEENNSSNENIEKILAEKTPNENILTLRILLYYHPGKVAEDIRKLKTCGQPIIKVLGRKPQI